MFLRSVTNWVLLRTVSGSRVAAALGSRPRPVGVGRVRISGPSPIRLLITGGGLAVGYGVTEWDDALGAALGRALAEQSGRGVVIDQSPLPTVDPDEIDLVISSLDGAGYDLVLWSPTFTEDTTLPDPEGWRAGAKAVGRALGEGVCGCRGHVVLGVPEVQGDGRHERVITQNIRRANLRLAELAMTIPKTSFVRSPEVGPLDGTGPRLGRDYYDECARRIAPVATRILEGRPEPVA